MESFVHSRESVLPIDDLLGQAVESLILRLRKGERISLDQLSAEYPARSRELCELYPAIQMMVSMAEIADNHTANAELDCRLTSLPQQLLGDFRLIRELGRGGMGTVFEAEQVSLGRRVALKILPFAALAQTKSLQRFRNEVRAAAALDHPNIVSVYSVGEERGVHFYAMQLIRGRTLADVIHAASKQRGFQKPASDTSDDTAKAAKSDARDPASTKCDEIGWISTVLGSGNAIDFFDSAARLGIHAAEGLQHAHDQGVLHRDIKPGNLMVDSEGSLYVTDFGLARIDSDAAITMTGDIIGTLRYMAPEQALAKRAVVDHRADVYSLGATLYELLSLKPAFSGTDRAELLKQIAFEEPPALSSIDPAIPTDLETIVLKAMAKEPRERYETAQRLSDDLRAYLEHRPIAAKRPTIRGRIAKWSRRNVAVAWTAVIGSTAISVILAVATLLIADSRQEANLERMRAEEDRSAAIAQRNEARRNQYNAEIVSGQADLEHGNVARLQQKLIRHLPSGDDADLRGWEWYYLFSHCHPEARSLSWPSRLLFASWSPDGKLIAGAGAIWDAESGECRRVFSPSIVLAEEGTWSPDSTLFAWGVSSDDSAIYLWNRKSEEIRELRGHESSVWCVSFSPDGKRLASGSIDHTIKIWDVATGSVIRSLDAGGNVSDIEWSPDGQLITGGVCWGVGVRVWSVETGEQLFKRMEADQPRVRVAWHPDGQQLAVSTGARWYVLRRDDWSELHQHEIQTPNGIDSTGADIAWSPSGNQLAITRGNVVEIWAPNQGQVLTTLTGHVEPVNSISWSPDGRRLVTADAFSDVRIWDLKATGESVDIATGTPLQRLSWEADNKTLVSVAAAAESVSYWRASDGAQQKTVVPAKLDNGRGYRMSPDCGLVACITKENGKQQISIRSTLTGDIHSIWQPSTTFEASTYEWSADGSKLAILINSATDTGLECWDVNHEKLLSRWSRRKVDVYRHELVAWSPNGKRVALAGWGDVEDSIDHWSSNVIVVDVESGKRILKRTLGNRPRYGGHISGFAWSQNSDLLAWGSSQGIVEAINVSSRQNFMSCKTHDTEIGVLQWNTESDRLVTAARDGRVKIIDAVAGNELMEFRMTGSAATHACWSSDGRQLAVASGNGTIRLWNATRAYEFDRGKNRSSELAWTYQRASRDHSGNLNAAALRRSIELASCDLGDRYLRGIAFADLREFDSAAREFQGLLPGKIELGFKFAILRQYALLGSRDLEAFRKEQRVAALAVRGSKAPSNEIDVAWLGCLIPNAVDNFDKIIASTYKIASERPSDGTDASSEEPPNDFDALRVGAMLYRIGRNAEAAQILSGLSTRLSGDGDASNRLDLACAKYFLAMARQKAGHAFQARRLLVEAQKVDETLQKDPALNWINRVELDTLRREGVSQLSLEEDETKN